MSDQFPVMLYKSPGPHEIHGGKFDYTIAADEEAATAALADGWHLTTAEAKEAADAAANPPPSTPAPAPAAAPEPADDAAPTRDELKQKADELGIEYAKNIPTEKLIELVEAALATPQGDDTAPDTEQAPE